MHEKNKDTKSFTELGKYLLNGYFFDSIAKSCKEKRNLLHYFTYFNIILYDFINCTAFVDIKQTLHYKVAIE